MSKSVYDADRFFHIVRVVAVAAVLLSLVAAIGYYLMTGGIGYKVVIALVLTDMIAIVALKTARGSQRRARARAAFATPAAPPPVRPVHDDGCTYTDGLHGIKVPLGEALGIHI
jgi:hypothetical protein